MLFLLWLCVFTPSGVISPLFSSSILGTYRPGEFIFHCHIFLPFHIVHGVLKARILKWFSISFSSPVDHILSELSTMTCPNWVTLQAMAHSFIELDWLWPMWSVWLVSVIVVFILSALWWMRIRGLRKLPDGRDWLRGKLTNWSHGLQPCLTQWNYEPCHVGPPKINRSWWRVLTKYGPLERRMATHFNILALRTPWTVWKGKKIKHWKMNSPGQ